MYFTSEVQANILASFHFALAPGGYLFLGKSEALVTRTQMFHIIDMHQHILRKDGTTTDIAVLTSPASGRSAKAARNPGRPTEAAIEASPVAQVVLDAGATIVLANRTARQMLSIGSAELGRPLRGTESALRPIDLRVLVERVLRERRPVRIDEVPWHTSSKEPMTLDVTAVALDSQDGVMVTFIDVTRYQHLREELETSRRELENAWPRRFPASTSARATSRPEPPGRSGGTGTTPWLSREGEPT